MNFKELIEKKADRSYNPKTKRIGKPERLSIKSIGEWAWNMLKETDEIDDYLNHLPLQDNYKVNAKSIEEFADKGDWICIYWEITVACLGEKEVKKRLTNLQDNTHG